ncbi:MAG: hypothetical protein ACPG3V_01665 [Porticoccaceae bacterium]
MRELTKSEIAEVTGGTTAGNIPFGVASTWAATVAGFGVGIIVGGPAGALAGAAVGFGIGVATSVGYNLATSGV